MATDHGRPAGEMFILFGKFQHNQIKEGNVWELYTRYPIVARALGLAFRPSASREQRYLAYNCIGYTERKSWDPL